MSRRTPAEELAIDVLGTDAPGIVADAGRGPGAKRERGEELLETLRAADLRVSFAPGKARVHRLARAEQAFADALGVSVERLRQAYAAAEAIAEAA